MVSATPQAAADDKPSAPAAAQADGNAPALTAAPASAPATAPADEKLSAPAPDPPPRVSVPQASTTPPWYGGAGGLAVERTREDARLAQLLTVMEKRAKKHGLISYAFLAAMIVVSVFAIYIIAEARTVLGGDLDRARRNVELDRELNAQRTVLTQEEGEQTGRVERQKKELLTHFGKDQAWLSAGTPPSFTGDLHWVDLRGDAGFAIGVRVLFTPDQGRNWYLAEVDNPTGGEPFEPTNAFSFGGHGQQYFGWVTGKRGKIARSINGGRTWKIVTARYAGSDRELDPGDNVTATFNYVFFKDAKTGWAVGDDGLIARSDDGGESWVVVDAGVSKANLYFARFYNDATSIAIGADRTVLVSSNGGKWEAADLSAAIKSDRNLKFLSMDLQLSEGYSAPGRVIIGGSDGTILLGERQQNGPLRWSLGELLDENGTTPRPLRGDIAEVGALQWIERLGGSDHVVAVGNNATVLVSANLGRTWRRVTATPAIDPGISIRFAQAVSSDRAIILGGQNLVAKLELASASNPVKITRETTPSPNADWRWLSPSGQGTQVMVGVRGGVMQLVSFGKELAPFRESASSEDFRRIAASPALQKAALDVLPANSYLSQIFSSAIAEITRSNEELEKVKKRRDVVNERKEKNLHLQEITSQEFMLWLNGARVLVILIAFFLIRFLSTIYHYHLGLAAFYEARSDTLQMLGILPGSITELTAIFSPKPLEETVSGGMMGDLVSAAKGLLGK